MSSVYLNRADQMARGRDYCRGKPEYAAATALLAVHSAIALNDAILFQLKGSRGKGADHSTAVRDIEKLCKEKKLGVAGVKHLKTLLSAKSDISYGDRRTTQDFAETLAFASERFQNWAYGIIKELM